MSFNELNSVEHFIIQKLSGRNLNAQKEDPWIMKEDAPVHGSFPWQYRSADEKEVAMEMQRLVRGDAKIIGRERLFAWPHIPRLMG